MRVVLDTNVVVSAILFQHGRLIWLRDAWMGRAIFPLVDQACISELLRVLAYPKFRLNSADIAALLGSYLPYTQTITNHPGSSATLPPCPDPHDQKFLELATAGKADTFVTGDKALLSVAELYAFTIETPETLHQRLSLDN